MLSWFRDQ